MRLGPPPEEPEIPGQFWIDFIRDTAPVFRKPTIEQLGEFIAPTFQALIDGAKYVDPRLLEIIDELGPDVIVEDNVVGVPGARARPGGRGSASCRATRPRSRTRPSRRSRRATRRPTGATGRPSSRRSAGRTATCGPTSTRSAASTASRACRTAPLGPDFIAESPWLNLYSLPGRGRLRARARRSARPGTALDSSVRAADTTWELPDHLAGARRRADLPVAGLPRLGGRRADAAPGRPARARPSTGSSSRRARSPTRSRSTTTRPGRGSCRSRRSCRRSTSSSPTAATTPSPRRSTTASR